MAPRGKTPILLQPDGSAAPSKKLAWLSPDYQAAVANGFALHKAALMQIGDLRQQLYASLKEAETALGNTPAEQDEARVVLGSYVEYLKGILARANELHARLMTICAPELMEKLTPKLDLAEETVREIEEDASLAEEATATKD